MWQWLTRLTHLQTFKFLVDKSINQEEMPLRKLTYLVTVSRLQ